MANALYGKGREAFLSASLSWLTATVVPYLVSSYNVAINADTFLSDIPLTGNMWKARGTYLTTRGAALGVASAANTLIAAVGSGGAATAQALILVAETGASQTSLLIAYIDTASVLPFVPNGGDEQVNWDPSAATCIFKL